MALEQQANLDTLHAKPTPRELLLSRPIPPEYPLQIERYTLASLDARPAGLFNPHRVKEVLQQSQGQEVVAIDIGGDKLRVGDGKVSPEGKFKIGKVDVVANSEGEGDWGKNYLIAFEKIGKEARDSNIPVGISTAGTVQNQGDLSKWRMEGTYNIKSFTEGLANAYGGDLSQIMPTLASLDNDAPPPLKATLVSAMQDHPQIKNAIEIIVGGGLGGTLFLQTATERGEGAITSLEPGHVQVVPELQTVAGITVNKLCEVSGKQRDYVCIENIAGGKAMESMLQSILQTDKPLTGFDMVRILEGDNGFQRTAVLTVLDNAANAVAHVVQGIDHAVGGKVLDAPETALLAWHGGIFNIPGFRERVEAILTHRLSQKLERPVQLITMKTADVDPNAAMIGAGLSAIANLQTERTIASIVHHELHDSAVKDLPLRRGVSPLPPRAETDTN